jgi:2-iminobutanoate/2-iminopropanoate deaminase
VGGALNAHGPVFDPVARESFSVSDSQSLDFERFPRARVRVHEGIVYVSGTTARVPGEDLPPDFETQAERSLVVLARVLDSVGASMKTVLKTTVFMTDRADVAAMNAIYEQHFTDPFPARSTVVADLVTPDMKFEIEAIAHLES